MTERSVVLIPKREIDGEEYISLSATRRYFEDLRDEAAQNPEPDARVVARLCTVLLEEAL